MEMLLGLKFLQVEDSLDAVDEGVDVHVALVRPPNGACLGARPSHFARFVVVARLIKPVSFQPGGPLRLKLILPITAGDLLLGEPLGSPWRPAA